MYILYCIYVANLIMSSLYTILNPNSQIVICDDMRMNVLKL